MSMKKYILFGVLLTVLFSCKDEPVEINYVAEVVAYNLNCETCILHFQDNLDEIKALVGTSELDYYDAVNLSQTEYNIGQLINVKVRLVGENELLNCKTLYPSFEYTNIYITHHSEFKE